MPIMKLERASLRLRLLAGSALVLALLFAFAAWNTSRLMTQGIKASAGATRDQMALTLNAAIAPYATSGRLGEIKAFFEDLVVAESDSITYIRIVDSAGTTLMSAGVAPEATLPAAVPDTPLSFDSPVQHVRRPVLLDQNKVGFMQFGMSTGPLVRAHRNILLQGALISIAAILVAISFLHFVAYFVFRRLEQMIAATRAIARGDYMVPVPEFGNDEVSALASSINMMRRSIQDRMSELIHSEARFSSAFNASPVPMLISRRSDGRIFSCNAAFRAMTGYSDAEIIGTTSAELELWPDSVDRQRWIEELTATGMVRELPIRFRSKTRELRSCVVSSTIIDIGGEPYILSLGRDVTELEVTERKVRESMAKYETVFDTTPEAIVISRVRDGMMIEMNAAWAQESGYTRERGLGHSALELGLWAREADRNELLARLDRDGRVTNFESQFVRADRSVRDVLISCARIVLEGEPCIAWAWRDVTEYKRIERERRESESRYRSLFESAQDAIVVLSPQGELLDINPAGVRSIGYSREELVGRPIDLLFDPQELARNPLRLREIFKHGAVRVERSVRTKEGRLIPTEIIGGALSDGNIQAIVRDVSARRQKEDLLQNIARGVSATVGEEYFQSLVSYLTWELSADYAFVGEILRADPARVRTIAFCADGKTAPNFEYALPGSPCINAISQHGSVSYPAHVADQFPQDRGLKKFAVEGYVGTSLYDAEGRANGILVVMSRRPLADTAVWIAMIEIFGARAGVEIARAHAEAEVRELNASLEKRVAERTAALEAANGELESFSYSVSHDLRAPLRAIGGFAEILRASHAAGLDGEAAGLLGRIENNATRMNRLIDDLLEFSRAGRKELVRRRVNMRTAVEAVLADLPAGSTEKAIIELGELPTAQGDASLLREVWQNLIGNAVKYSRHARPPRIEIGSVAREGAVEYYVRDNGAGFDMAYADKLFGVFQRLHTEKEFEGTGVGLAIVQRILARHGGRVWAESSPGRGATFRFALPSTPACS